jgi:hypothetical protein
MSGRVLWWRDNERGYRSRESCQRACDWLNRQGGSLWREPVIAAGGDHYEMWTAVYEDLWPSQRV